MASNSLTPDVYPERFAQQALGHNSKPCIAYARKAQVTLSLEQYEKEFAERCADESAVNALRAISLPCPAGLIWLDPTVPGTGLTLPQQGEGVRERLPHIRPLLDLLGHQIQGPFIVGLDCFRESFLIMSQPPARRVPLRRNSSSIIARQKSRNEPVVFTY